MNISAKALAHLLQGTLIGNPDREVNNFSGIEQAQAGDLSFVSNPKYYKFLESSKASIILIPLKLHVQANDNTTYIQVNDPYSALPFLLDYINPSKINNLSGIEPHCFIHESAQISADVYIASGAYVGANCRLGKGTKIFANTSVGDNSVIGDNCIIYSGVNIYNDIVIGSNCIVHSGAVIGSDGFGFAPQADGSYKKIPQKGNVILEDNVEIGANTTIDRATMGSTIIKKGCKLDNLIQVAHNVVIDENTVIAAQAGIAGSAKIGKNVMVGGQAGISGHLAIADGVKINAQSGISKTVSEAGKSLSGSPATDYFQHYKLLALTRQIPELIKRIEELESRLK